MSFQLAQRLKALPPYLFKEIDRLRDEVRKKGVDIIDLGVGDPDQPTPDHVIAALAEAAKDPSTHKYPAYSGMDKFRSKAAAWYSRRFNVQADPKQEVITLIGSKEGLAHFPLAFVNPGDVVLVPSPAYPVYNSSTIMAGGRPVEMPLTRENGFLPDLDAIDPAVLKQARIMVINYPNNPTAAVADLDFYGRVVAFAKKHKLIVVSDAAYTEMAYDGYRPCSFLEADGAMDVGIEFHSLSKTYNMTGWRLGFAVGNAELITGMGLVKSQIDSGAFDAVQLAGIAALEGRSGRGEEPVRHVPGAARRAGGRSALPGPGGGTSQGHLLCLVPYAKWHEQRGVHQASAERMRGGIHPGLRVRRPGRGLCALCPVRGQGPPHRGRGPAEKPVPVRPTVVALVEVYVGLGSNLGEPEQNIAAGLKGLAGLAGMEEVRASSLYLTAPVGKTDQPAFVNAVARAAYSGLPLDLLAGLMAIEKQQGRVRRERWGARTLDLDILLFGDEIIDLPELKVPHPEIPGRAFVLVPLAELAPRLVLPGFHRTAAQLLGAMDPAHRAGQAVEKI
jgi:LL-diaminopimelate aminotransferase